VLPAVFVGTIETGSVDRTILEPSLTTRLGLFDWLQLEAIFPWRYSNERHSLTNEEITIDDTAFGDIEAGLSAQLMKEKGPWPALVGAVRVRTTTGQDLFDIDSPDELPTGSGFWGVRGILSAIKVRDPIVIFGNIGYTYNIPRTGDFGFPQPAEDVEIDPGDTIEWGLGFAYAISPEISLNMQYVHRLSVRSDMKDSGTLPEEQEGKLPGTYQNVPELKLGTVWNFKKNRFIDFSVSIGLSEDAPDVTVQIGMPFRF